MAADVILTPDFGEPPLLRPRRRYVRTRPVAGLKAPDLKAVILDAASDGLIDTAAAEDLISFYGLRHA